MKIRHCRYYKGEYVRKTEKFDTVITIVYSYGNKTITYAGVKYDVIYGEEKHCGETVTKHNWDKRLYRELALAKYKSHPVNFVLKENTSIPKIICEKAIPLYGMGDLSDDYVLDFYRKSQKQIKSQSGKTKRLKNILDRTYGTTEGVLAVIISFVFSYFLKN